MYLIIIASLLGIFATSVMSYISMATPIGPWIAPTLVLCGTIFFHFIRPTSYENSLSLVTCAGSVGGILASALAFSFPTLHFLDPILFANIMASPICFAAHIVSVSIVAGWFGIWIANLFEDTLVYREKLAYPIGALVYRMIETHHDMRKACELIFGITSSALFAVAQDIIHVIAKSFTMVHSFSLYGLPIPTLQFDLSPLLWAVGFVTGHVIAIPLALGALARVFIASPINILIFPDLTHTEFNFAFCSGILLYTTMTGIFFSAKKLYASLHFPAVSSVSFLLNGNRSFNFLALEGVLVVCTICVFLSYFKFSMLCQLYLIPFTFVCTRQILIIAGKFGLAPLGTFATFVMFPALFLFDLSAKQMVLIATFVEVCGGVAADILFGRKIGSLANISKTRLKLFQYAGLIIGSLTAGIIFWLLIKRFSLGSVELFAGKAQSRALLIQSVDRVNFWAMVPGTIFACLVQYCGINAALALGGLLMPFSISIGLVTGAMLTFLTHHKEEWFPFWSGIFAAQSIWMLLRAAI